MKLYYKILLIVLGVTLSGVALGNQFRTLQIDKTDIQVSDTVQPRFPVQKTSAEEMKNEKISGDLRNPENLKTDIFYDEKTGEYRFGTKLGDNFLTAPFYMSPKEYEEWCAKRSAIDFFRKKNKDDFDAKGKEKFDFTDMKFDLGPASKIFGPGGVRIKTQGSAELKIGANTRFVDNPSLSERNRRVFGFDFNEKINLSVSGKVGDKVNMDFNYNSEATFNFDTQNIKLRYEGKEDEIIKLLEAGNVSLPSNSSLIRGAQSLFGIRADMQFGKLKLQTVMSQKKSSSQSVNSKGGVQLTQFEIPVDEYDENRHFFLSHFFREHYDDNMKHLPNIVSGIDINRIEVWVTNKSGATNNTRNIIALTDLAESEHTGNPMWGTSSLIPPTNSANGLYQAMTTECVDARDISMTNPVLDGAGLVGGDDYEKLESARLLTSSEYKLNASLGYISLRTTLQPDQVLAVAYEYTYRGTRYQVGEFSTDLKDNKSALFVKALKNTACTPQMANWDLMMRNVYSLGATSVQKDKFKLDIKILSDSTGVYLSYLPEPDLKNQKILSLVGLDRLDNNNKHNPNAYFDFVEGYTIDTESGRIFFPVAEPFGENLRRIITDAEVADKYVYQELYDSTKTIAKQIAEKNKYRIVGEYKATKRDEIQLGAMNIPRGSVVVTAGGVTLMEGSDYTVDYYSGIVKILNKSILDAGTNVNVSLESNTDYGMQRKSMFGVNWQYDFTNNFQIGGTLMHLGEKPLTTKVSMGSEPLNNTLWGLNLSWKKQSQWLTDMIDKLPLIECSAPSSINLTADFAHLIAGKNKGSQGNASYIDDFENAKNGIDISNPEEWNISSVPSTFAESSLLNDVRSGYNRAKLAWYTIDPIFTRRSSSITPGHIKGDLKQLSDPDVREVYKNELFPNKSINFREASTLNVLNLAYYPNERGPYNLDPNLDVDGKLLQPEKRWGGMMRKLETSDFESANIEYIEFWMMDPYIKSRQNGTLPAQGDLYFNLGEISEDILKDGKKFYESGLLIDGDATQYTETQWGRVPTQNSVTYAFNTASDSRQKQDVGYNGLTSEQELEFPAYKNYLEQIRPIVRPEVYDSIVMSPSADRYHFYRGTDFDEREVPILQRYKDINNPNGNSVDADHSPEKYSTAYKTQPNVEDINQDYTLNEYEKYYQYRVRISPEEMQVGNNYIVDKRTANIQTRDGEKREVDWYLFRIPLDQYEKRQGNIADFSSIRFIRMYMTGFSEPVVLRLATLDLVYGQWRSYEQALYADKAPEVSGTMSVSAVNFEENNEKTPVNYVLPPGISRVIDPGQDQVLQNNEQAISMTLRNLASGDARAIYKNLQLDLRRYKHLQMFIHANSLPGQVPVADGQTSLFLRLGSDYKNNFYEYEIPLAVTPEGKYANSDAGARIVWPASNMLDIDLSIFTDLKRNRNQQKAQGLATYHQPYSEYDTDKPANKVSIVGNPSLGEVRTIMIGVRNNSRTLQHVEVWANELRLQQFSNKGGWAAQGALNMQLSDLASVNLTGHVETDGFGGLEEGVSQRRDDNLYQYSVTTNVDAGRLLPEKVKLKAPIYYSYSKERTSPRYNPLDTDMEMEESLESATTTERDSIKNIADRVVENRNFSISGVRFDIASKKYSMPYDPANFTVGYSHSRRNTTGHVTAWEKDENWKVNFGYTYNPNFKPFEPFKKLKGKSKWLKIVKDFNVNYAPQSLTFSTDLVRRYYELQERDMENLENQSLPLTWSSDFTWNRNFALRWDLAKSLHFNFSSGTNAEVEQPYTAVNEDLYPDRYTAWKDSVWQSIRHLGTPLTYQQSFDASWQVPLNKLPLFDWLTADAKYNATYNWNRGTSLSTGMNMGGVVSSSRTASGNVRLKMETLYNHIPFLKEANKRFSTSGINSAANKKNQAKKNYTSEVQLKPDTTVTVKHNQRSKKLRVTALRPDGTKYPVKFKVLDNNSIQILSQDTVKVKITVQPKKRKEEQGWYQGLQLTARVAMLVRNVSVSYTNKYSMALPGFLPLAGDIFGQRATDGGYAPGLRFAFGMVDDSYIDHAVRQGWLLQSDSIITPATSNMGEDLQIRATLEPFTDVKIDLNASRSTSQNSSTQYMIEGMPRTYSGSFNMTTMSIHTAFESMGDVDRGYKSASFDRFLGKLQYFQQKTEALYRGSTYPHGSALAGQPFDPKHGTVGQYSAGVMIPAFLDTYTLSGRDGLSLMPALTALLPNWTIKYAGLAKLPRMKKVFKSFNINHSYKSIYSIGSYNTFTSFQAMNGSHGFITDVTTGLPTPSTMYDMSTVSLNETFSPLAGIDMTFNNNLTAKVEYRKTRALTLSMTSGQITEARSNDLVVGLGYKIADLNLFAPRKAVRMKGDKRSSKGKSAKGSEDESKSSSSSSSSKGRSSSSGGFSQDLNLRFDLTFRNQSGLNRDIMTALTQATSGNRALQISFSADYALSKYLTLTAYYDRQFNKPLLTTSSYPITTQDFGVTVKFVLNR